MLGSEYNWLITQVRFAAGRRVRLVRSGLLTLLVASLCILGTILPATMPAAHVAAVAAPATASLDSSPHTDWPRTLTRLWFLLPPLVPNDN